MDFILILCNGSFFCRVVRRACLCLGRHPCRLTISSALVVVSTSLLRCLLALISHYFSALVTLKMPVECIDWRRFAYGRTSGESASLPKVPRARRLEDALQEEEAAAPANAAAESEAKTPVAPAATAETAGTTGVPAVSAVVGSAACTAGGGASEGQSDGAAAAAGPEPITPPVRLASLHDRGGSRSGWLSFGSSSNDRSSNASRSRTSQSGSTGRASGKSNSKSSGSAAKQRAPAPGAPAQQQTEPGLKRRKLLRGGVAACGAADSDVECISTAQPGAATSSTRLSSSGRSACRSSSSSESEGTDSDEESLDALQLCLQESEAMTDLLVEELGGPTEEGRAQVRGQIGEGRCHCRTSLGIPESLQQHCGEGWERLKDYQKCGVHWLAAMHRANRNGILADEMGLVSSKLLILSSRRNHQPWHSGGAIEGRGVVGSTSQITTAPGGDSSVTIVYICGLNCSCSALLRQ